MITATVIRAGTAYLDNHLKHADYYSENNQVVGEWLGKACPDLGLDQQLDFDEAFNSLASQLHPVTGERLTSATRDNAVSFFDVTLSAPKDFSVLCELASSEEERTVLKEMFAQEAREVFKDLEEYSSIRDRKGEKRTSDDSICIGKMAGAIFIHEHNRNLDPQQHAHMVIANAVKHPETGEWMALQAREMMRASKYIRQKFYDRLSDRLESMGYETHEHSRDGFNIVGMEKLRERFSTRRAQIDKAIEEFKAKFGYSPTPAEVSTITKETREKKLREIEPEQLRELNKNRLSPDEQVNLDSLKSDNPLNVEKITAEEALDGALRHLLERESVTDEFNVLATAYELYGGRIEGDLKAVYKNSRAVVIGENYNVTTEGVIQQELESIAIVERNLESCEILGDFEAYKEQIKEVRESYIEDLTKEELEKNNGQPLSEEQIKEIERKSDQSELLKAGEILLNSTSRVSVLIGDAGTGKTFGMSQLERVITDSGGKKFVGIGPTGRARDQLLEDGIEGAVTVAKFLIDEEAQAAAAGKTIIVDEDGILGIEDKNKLLNLLEKIDARMILIGDAKQHEAVARGNGLQMLMESCPHIPVARLGKVRRQEGAEDRKISELMAENKFSEAIDLQLQNKQIVEIKKEDQLFSEAADYFVDKVANKEDIFAVCPTWGEIGKFSEEVRSKLKKEGLLDKDGIERTATKSLSYTEEQKRIISQYKEGQLLVFHGKTTNVAKGETLEVVKVDKLHIMARNSQGQEIRITSRQAKAFDVCEKKKIEICRGDKVMLKSNLKGVGSNGDILTVQEIDGTLTATNKKGKTVTIPEDFTQIDYGYAVTSHKSQGASIPNSMLVMGQASTGVANKRQYYVSNTRHKKTHKAFVRDVSQLRKKVESSDLEVKYGHTLKRKIKPTVKQVFTQKRDHRHKQYVKQYLQNVKKHVHTITRKIQSSLKQKQTTYNQKL